MNSQLYSETKLIIYLSIKSGALKIQMQFEFKIQPCQGLSDYRSWLFNLKHKPATVIKINSIYIKIYECF
jgi:hypothetical protein